MISFRGKSPCLCAGVNSEMAAAAASVPVRELDDVTECPICAEGFTDARVLPCIHTFCLKCLQDYAKNTKPGGKCACPLCRQDFTVPEGGLPKLPRNYFVEKVLEVKKLAARLSHDDVQCDLCGPEKDASGGKVDGKAFVFCTDCSRNMCEQCFNYHKMFKANATHKVIGLNEEHGTEDLLSKFPENHCDKHTEESIKLYCFECKLVVCMMCYVEQHNSHKCSDVKNVAAELTKQLDGDISNLRQTDGECNKVMKKVESDEKKFTDNSAQAEQAICAEAEKLHNLVDRYKQVMLDELSQVKKNQYKKMESIREETELHSVIIRNFIHYGTELKQKGTPCDIAKSVDSLRTRAGELRQFNPDLDYNIKVRFTGSSSYDEVKRVYGELSVKGL